jgi:hypothetical protein
MKNFVVIVISLFLVACIFPTSNHPFPEGPFAIYLLQDTTVTAGSACLQPIDSLVLRSLPFLSVSDLKWYGWTTHAFALTEDARVRYEQFALSHGKTSGVPFVVTVGNDRIYVGTFWWAYSSSMPPACAVIDAGGPLPYRIHLANGAIDKRSDPRIYLSLKASGILVE